jgi:hypothetical protein
MVRELAEEDHLPDYHITVEGNMVAFRNRMSIKAAPAEARYPVLDPEAYLHAKQVAAGYDVYYLEQEWRN